MDDERRTAGTDSGAEPGAAAPDSADTGAEQPASPDGSPPDGSDPAPEPNGDGPGGGAGGGSGDGAGGGGAPAGRRRRIEGDPTVFVLERELSEVHLLLDNISADGTASISDPKFPRPESLPPEWIEKVCEVNWPPEDESDNASDAALLINAKDYLNRLSDPASGATIAFTLLVTQKNEAGGADQATGGTSRAPWRRSMAETAYPDLIVKAEKFRKAMWLMSVGLFIALVVTCALSWNVAYGNALLAELATASTNLEAAQTRVNQAEGARVPVADDEGSDAAPGTGRRAPQAATGQTDGAADPAVPFVPYCARPETAAEQHQACDALDRATEAMQRVQTRLANWECWFCWGSERNKPAQLADAPSAAAAWANILGSAVLPFLYGLLGAGAAIIRSLSFKIRSSLLSPRDLHLSFQQLALGAVVGACIGLFVAAPDSGADGEGLLGPVALSASAISFVAGFGVEAVFQALEALITRIFNLTSAGNGPRNDGSSRP
jgi:hypothetical protein